MRKKLLTLTCAIAMLSTAPAYAQSDWGGSYNLEFSKKIGKKLTLSFEEEYRTRNNFRSTERFMTTIGADYKLNRFLKIGADYTLINIDTQDNQFYDWEVRHRWSAFITASHKIGRFKISLREKFQQTYRMGVPSCETDSTYNTDEARWEYEQKERSNPKKMLRSRLQVSYDIKKSKFEPYAAIELSHLIDDPINTGLARVRYTVGTDYKLSKHSKLNLFYRYNDEKTTNRKGDEYDPDSHYIGVGFSHEF